MPGRPRRSDSRRFWRRLPWTLLGAALVWLVLRPGYNTLLTSTAQGLCRIGENPPVTQVSSDGEAAVIGRADMRVDSGRLRFSLTQIHFNLVPFLALVLALPGWSGKGGWQGLVSALLLLAISHVLALLWHVQFFFATALGPWSAANYSALSREVLGGLQYFFDIAVTFTLPLLLWVGFFSGPVSALLGLGPRPEAK
ncbi:MAG: hypothetical protein MUF10_12625 [Thermoanaerobaculaceae bacterium]|jgi:hypothetical protein|nr:hypothetical protein [Thermoanaerobaculaceae bacterium]